jgi:transcription elongation factor Elf1
MNLYPFYEVADEAHRAVKNGATVHQQFNCSHCGTKQTVETPNVFHKLGLCEECGHTTNIEQDGCNFMCILAVKAQP